MIGYESTFPVMIGGGKEFVFLEVIKDEVKTICMPTMRIYKKLLNHLKNL